MCTNNSKTQINHIINKLKKEHFNIVKWEPNNLYYPEYMFLGTDRGILAYIDFFTHIELPYLFCDFDNILEKTRLAVSDLDRPIFYIHLVNNSSFFCFETDEQVKDRIFTNDNYFFKEFGVKYYNIDIDQTGSYDELIYILKKIKKGEKV
ncbi:MAG: hypothetical protein NC213_05890 [Acetobacter sp.]|nr:hypothetical protein [Bacteroides sp.]MCM1341259.1 hypothetical protein [Acetobacter sp.]MCM1433964.1 hypothetical protein [Clostridiales bacterium]